MKGDKRREPRKRRRYELSGYWDRNHVGRAGALHRRAARGVLAGGEVRKHGTRAALGALAGGGEQVTDTDNYNAAFIAVQKASRKLEQAYNSGRGIKEACAAYESARRAMNEARNIMDERLNKEASE